MQTQNQNNFIFYVLLLLVSVTGFAQGDKDTRTFQCSFVAPIGTNGLQSGNITNDLSLNLIAGFNGGVNSFELGGIYNVTSGYVRGAQISGFGNAVGGEVRGAQIAGFINTNKGYLQGVQVAGFTNVVADSVQGTQIAGFANVSKSNRGTQVAGFSNHNKGTNGVQIAGFTNTSGDVDGAQVAGFVNVANELKGAQIGAINIADSIASGVQIGLININRNGFISLGMETDDVMPLRAAFRSGSDRFYTTIVGGVDASNDYWSLGAGLGSRIFLSKQKKVFVNPEARWEQIVKGKVNYNKFNHLTKLNLNVGYHFQKQFYMIAGPSYNFYVTNDLNANGQPVIELSSNQAYDKLSKGKRYQSWLGYTVGVGFKF